MSDTLGVSTLQHNPTPCDTAACLARLEKACADSAEAGSQILLLPEASMTGYNITLSERNNCALGANDPVHDQIAQLAQRFDIAINYGFIEEDQNRFFNTVQLVDCNGRIQSKYRKTHLWGDLDRTLFSAGEAFSPVVDFAGWKIGQLICYDVEFPEAVRQLALNGAELVLISTALMQPWTTVADLIVPARAAENQLYIAYGNYSGEENDISYVGHSCIAGPTGNVLSKATDQPTLLHAQLDKGSLTEIRQALPYFRDRRPELYR